MLFLEIIVALVLIGIIAYFQISLRIWSSILLLLLVIHSYFNSHVSHISQLNLVLLWCLFMGIIFPLNVFPLRRRIYTKSIFNFYKKNMPRISSTEKEAIEAGTVSWDAEIFNGNPRWQKLIGVSNVTLSSEEKNFIEGPVENLCQQLNDWEITHKLLDLPEEVWIFLKSQGFFGLVIPKQYGGKGFSAFAHSEILMKVAGVSMTAATTISVPNSLGPAELILHYGTDTQKNYYLPRLAKGEEIPCFALTSPEAGSDASSIIDTGIVSKGVFEGKEVIGIRLNWNKRYITLAPIATVLGLAFKLYDPEKLLGEEKTEYGITCALIPTILPGITIGRRHFPVNTAFLNGPTQGKNVFIPLAYIIGGKEMAGQGWRMLVECLSVGRAISLPSIAIGAAKMAVFATSSYARIRQQFHLPIGKFEGVAEVIARMSAYFYLMEAARRFTLSLISQGEKPAVISAIMKYHMTELGRKITLDAMDVHGGKAICLGPKNYLGRSFEGVPIAITVEGANILTRSLIIFGQGALRCHFYAMKEMQAIEKNDLSQFDQAFWAHAGLFMSHMVRSFILGLTQGILVKNPVLTLPTRRYFHLISRFSSAFALLENVVVIVLNRDLKRREMLSGRMGDILSSLYLISTVLKRYEDEGLQAADLPLVDWVCQYFFFEIQTQFDMILQNFPHRGWRLLLRLLMFPLGKWCKKPKDLLSTQIAELMLKPTATRMRLTQGIYKSNNMLELDSAFSKMIEIEPFLKKTSLTEEESSALEAAHHAAQVVIGVDDFSDEELKNLE